MLAWYVFVIKPFLTHAAQKLVSAQGFETYFPKIRSERGNAVDLFPGYGMVMFDVVKDFWQPINRTYGVRGLLPIGHEHPDSIPTSFVEHVMAHIDEITAPVSPGPLPAYRHGDKVHVLTGPLAGHTGKFTSRKNKGWAEIEVPLFGGIVKTSVKLHQLQHALAN